VFFHKIEHDYILLFIVCYPKTHPQSGQNFPILTAAQWEQVPHPGVSFSAPTGTQFSYVGVKQPFLVGHCSPVIASSFPHVMHIFGNSSGISALLFAVRPVVPKQITWMG
jgi:hypothetical protein